MDYLNRGTYIVVVKIIMLPIILIIVFVYHEMCTENSWDLYEAYQSYLERSVTNSMTFPPFMDSSVSPCPQIAISCLQEVSSTSETA